MEEATAPAGSRDRCRVMLTVGGKTVIEDILVSGLDDEVLKAECLSGWDAETVALHRGTPKGMEMMMAACLMHSNRGENYQASLVALWGLAHAPTGNGWATLKDLGGFIVRSEVLPGRGWKIDLERQVG